MIKSGLTTNIFTFFKDVPWDITVFIPGIRARFIVFYQISNNILFKANKLFFFTPTVSLALCTKNKITSKALKTIKVGDREQVYLWMWLRCMWQLHSALFSSLYRMVTLTALVLQAPQPATTLLKLKRRREASHLTGLIILARMMINERIINLMAAWSNP